MNVVAPPKSGVPLASDENLFDSLFGSEQNLLSLLIAIRSADIDDDEKLDLRDLVLEYAQLRDADKKERVKNQIENTLKKYPAIVSAFLNNQQALSAAKVSAASQTVPDSASEVPKANPVSAKPRIGAGRLSPVFKAVAKKATPEVPTNPVTEIKTGTEPAPTPTPTPEVKVKPEVSAPPAASAPIAPHVANPVERISEIKRLVNSKVGNPINLIDSDNNVGREYMNALLDAMKKSSGSGLAGELDVAMARLEKAYLAVENHIAGNPEIMIEPKEQQPVEEVTPAPKVTTPEPVEVPKEEVIPVTPIAKIEPLFKKVVVNSPPPKSNIKEAELPIPEEIERRAPKTSGSGLVQEPEEDFREVAQAEAKPSALSSLAARLFVDRSQSGVAAPQMQKTKVAPAKEKNTMVAPSVSVSNPAPLEQKSTKTSIKDMAAETTLKPVSQESSVTQKITSFREEMKKRDAADKLPVTDLNAPEVTAGLSQLLSEWKLFKSSGFLGTGPSGINHPLYLQLRAMPMASVIAGRFEGSNPEIKQSITDYMNGWRYEQGLIHEMGETFEHYLRRVILHILERQSETPKA